MNSIEATSAIYEAISKLEIENVLVNDPKLQSFVENVRKLQWETDHELADYVSALSIFSYWLSNCPLPADSGMYAEHPLTRRLVTELESDSFQAQFYPDTAVRAIETLIEMQQQSYQPLLDQIYEIALDHQDNRIGVLVRQRNWVATVQALIDKDIPTGIEVLAPSDLSSPKVYDLLIVVGNHNAYPDNVFLAPRAPNIKVVAFSWHGKMRTIQSQLLQSNFIGIEPKLRVVGDLSSATNIQYQLSTPEPVTPYLEARLQARYQRREDGLDSVPAKLARLYGDNSVFLHASGEDTILVIDPENDTLLVKVKTSEIRPGMYILLRTDIRGDYVAESADVYLGESALELRMSLREWKAQLRIKVEAVGIKRVASDLRSLGLHHATELNVRNWCSAKSIATRKQSDFQIIMRYLNLDDKAEQYWHSARLVRNAHLRSGRRISTQLSQSIHEYDAHSMDKAGRIDFEHPLFGGARLSAFQIETISSNTTNVSEYDLLTLIGPEEG